MHQPHVVCVVQATQSVNSSHETEQLVVRQSEQVRSGCSAMAMQRLSHQPHSGSLTHVLQSGYT